VISKASTVSPGVDSTLLVEEYGNFGRQLDGGIICHCAQTFDAIPGK